MGGYIQPPLLRVQGSPRAHFGPGPRRAQDSHPRLQPKPGRWPVWRVARVIAPSRAVQARARSGTGKARVGREQGACRAGSGQTSREHVSSWHGRPRSTLGTARAGKDLLQSMTPWQINSACKPWRRGSAKSSPNNPNHPHRTAIHHEPSPIRHPEHHTKRMSSSSRRVQPRLFASSVLYSPRKRQLVCSLQALPCSCHDRPAPCPALPCPRAGSTTPVRVAPRDRACSCSSTSKPAAGIAPKNTAGLPTATTTSSLRLERQGSTWDSKAVARVTPLQRQLNDAEGMGHSLLSSHGGNSKGIWCRKELNPRSPDDRMSGGRPFLVWAACGDLLTLWICPPRGRSDAEPPSVTSPGDECSIASLGARKDRREDLPSRPYE
jgi:hypothetical protein